MIYKRVASQLEAEMRKMLRRRDEPGTIRTREAQEAMMIVASAKRSGICIFLFV